MKNIAIGLQQWIRKHRERRACQRFRRAALLLGHDISGLSDEQIKRGARRVAEVARMSGCSASDVATAMQMFGRHWDDHLRP